MDHTSAENEQPFAVSVLIVEPQSLVRAGLAALIESFSGFFVRGQVADSSAALAEVARQPIQVLLVEVALPGPSGLELLLELKRRQSSHPKVLFLYSDGSVELVRKALLSGAHGCLSKQASIEELHAALISCSKDRRYIGEDVMRKATAADRRYDLSAEGGMHDPLQPLSKREREIFFLLAHGHRNTAIAKRLFISPRTVETHRARIVQKLGFESNAELIRFAFKSGLLVE